MQIRSEINPKACYLSLNKFHGAVKNKNQSCVLFSEEKKYKITLSVLLISGCRRLGRGAPFPRYCR